MEKKVIRQYYLIAVVTVLLLVLNISGVISTGVGFLLEGVIILLALKLELKFILALPNLKIKDIATTKRDIATRIMYIICLSSMCFILALCCK